MNHLHIGAVISQHLEIDLALWILFFIGQLFWILACSAAAIRSRINPLKTRREYIWRNWDILLIRIFVGGIFFAILRHIGMKVAFEHLGWELPSWFANGQSPGWVWLPVGFGIDVAINQLGKWKHLPEPLREFLSEKIPHVPEEVVATVETTTKVTPKDESIPVTETKTTVPVTKPTE